MLRAWLLSEALQHGIATIVMVSPLHVDLDCDSAFRSFVSLSAYRRGWNGKLEGSMPSAALILGYRVDG
jgi:hypothetical protein